MMQAIRNWIGGLAASSPGLDWLRQEAGSLSVDSVPTSPQVRRYMDGGRRLRLDFVVSGREFLDDDPAGAAASLGLFEELGRRMESAPLPALGEGLTAERVQILSTAYPVSLDGHGTARYQMQCRLIFYKEGTL